jgi:two-component system, response regulator PdtaR
MDVILTVEDEFLLNEYLEVILRDRGYAVISVTNVDEAIAILESRDDVRLIVTDVVKLAAAVRGRWQPIKIVVTTGFRPPPKEEMPAGSLFLPKPYTPRLGGRGG